MSDTGPMTQIAKIKNEYKNHGILIIDCPKCDISFMVQEM